MKIQQTVKLAKDEIKSILSKVVENKTKSKVVNTVADADGMTFVLEERDLDKEAAAAPTK